MQIILFNTNKDIRSKEKAIHFFNKHVNIHNIMFRRIRGLVDKLYFQWIFDPIGQYYMLF